MLKQSWLIFWNSISDLKWYASLLKGSGWVTVYYSAVMISLLAVSGVLAFRFRDLPDLIKTWDQAQVELLERYPESLEISWDGQQLSSTQDPLIVPWPESFQLPESFPTQLGAITPAATGQSASDITGSLEASTLLLVTQNTVFVSNLSGDWLDFPLAEMPGFESEFSVSRGSLADQVAIINDRVTAAVYDLWLWTYPVFWFGYSLEILGMSLLYSFMLWLMARLSRLPLNWWRSWQLAIHLSLVARMIQELASWLAGNDLNYLSSLAFWVLAVLILNSIQPLLAPRK